MTHNRDERPLESVMSSATGPATGIHNVMNTRWLPATGTYVLQNKVPWVPTTSTCT